MPQTSTTFIAVDVGNSRIKLGRFDRSPAAHELPQPTATLELPLASRAGDFDLERFSAWCRDEIHGDAAWLTSSVQRAAAQRLATEVATLAMRLGRQWTLRQIAFGDVPLVVEVDEPERVGMDRLMGAVAADRLRPADRPALVVDFGTATKIAVLSDVGAFIGGAIMPGLAMSAAALHDGTDALPAVEVERWQRPPLPLGNSTVPAIESGVFWSGVGSVREFVNQYTKLLAAEPGLYLTGGGSHLVAEVLSDEYGVALRHEPHLVLAGVALVDAAGK